MVSNNKPETVLIELSEQQRHLLLAFDESALALMPMLQQAFVGDARRLTRSEHASLSRALRRLEFRGLLIRHDDGTVTLTPAGLALAFPNREADEAAKHAQEQTETARRRPYMTR